MSSDVFNGGDFVSFGMSNDLDPWIAIDLTVLDEWQRVLSPTLLGINSASLLCGKVYTFPLRSSLVPSAPSAESIALSCPVKVSNIFFCRFF